MPQYRYAILYQLINGLKKHNLILYLKKYINKKKHVNSLLGFLNKFILVGSTADPFNYCY